MDLEQPPQEPCREAEVLPSVREARRALASAWASLVSEIGDFLTQRQEARASRRFADEIRDQQPE